ncbi:MAG TPA: LamG-like jellyroll fold domain-containing protein [Tepidisphaeraceae bacterium]|jgi:hypothetical protein|nr:LamG-like jellyroll fold domain-containing protein [Tepidisphaeraceae bacterium]
MLSGVRRLCRRQGYRVKIQRRKILAERLESRVLLSASVLTYHNDNSRSGVNSQETILTPQNVNSADFGELFSYPVDGTVYAQPLYMSGVAMGAGGVHDVVFVATEHDSVYAFDSDDDSGADAQPLWHTSFVDAAAGVTSIPASAVAAGNITPEVGITGTPVIDATTNTLYVVSNIQQTNFSTGAVTYSQQLHALDIATGAEKFGGPVNIQLSLPGAGAGGQGGQISFNPLIESERAALALSDGSVYITWASYGDSGPYHGWIAAYNASDLQLESALNVTANGADGGIWASGGAPAIDSQGNLFLSVGNGTFDDGDGDYGDSMIEVTNNNGSLAVADSFTPFNQADLDQFDIDFGSGGVLLLPTQSGPDPDEAVGGGKDGNLYLVDADDLGGYSPTANTNLQTISVSSENGIYDTPAYFNGNVYVNAPGEGLESFPMVNGLLTGPSATSPIAFGYPGATPSISSDGAANGIVWEMQYSTHETLYAFDAANVADQLYDSEQAGARDELGQGVKFATPTVADGHVFVATADSVAVFGLLATAGDVVPATPSNLSATAISATDVQLNWQENSNNATSFSIERSTDGMTFIPIGSVPRTDTSYDDLTTDVGTPYWYEIQAENGAGTSPASNVAAASTPAVPGLVGYWQFNEDGGAMTVDASGNNDDGTLSEGIGWIAGRVGWSALSFAGAAAPGADVDIPNEPQLQFTAADSFTIGLWVQAGAPDGKWAGIVAKSADVAPGYGLYLDPSGHWAFAAAAGENVIEGPVADTSWHYLTLVQDGSAGTRSLYVDGALSVSGTAQDGSGAGDLWVGGAASSAGEFFDGAVDDLRVYNIALTAQQIQALAQVPATPAFGAGVIAGTVFQDDQQTGVQEDGEAGVGGVVVFIDNANTGVPEPNEPTQVTDANGNYRFTDLASGAYRVVAVPSNEEHLTAPAAGFAAVAISGGNQVSGVDFGETDNDQAAVLSQFMLTLKSKIPAGAVTASKGSVTVAVTNTSGVLFKKPLQLTLFLSSSPVLTSAASLLTSPTYKTITLPAGGTHSFKIDFTYLDSIPAGSYYLIASVTAEKSVGEDQYVVASANPIALAPAAVTLHSSIVNPGGVAVKSSGGAVASLRIENDGNVTADGSATIYLFASGDQQLDNGDTSLKSYTKRIRISPGGFASFALTISVPAALRAESLYVIAQVIATTVPADTNASGDAAVAPTRPA